MKRAPLPTLSKCPLATLASLLIVTPAYSDRFEFDGRTITVPDGFIVERIAAAPLTERPVTFDFDERGRMYIGESSGSNDSVEQQLAEKPHSILRLEDTDGDGVFDRRTVFADHMMFPEGTMWFDGSLYVCAPPEIWKLTDTDDDGVADEREIWFNPGTLTGCANDLHGPYLGPDGWIYWCKGAFARQELPLTTGGIFTTRAAHIFRRHPSGGGVEPVMTGGMDNPVEIAFSRGGERFFSSTFIQHPGGGRRDGLIHAIYGGVYGKIHNVIDEHPRTGGILEPMTHLGPAAACALMRYESDVFGGEYQDNLFASSFNLHKVTRHRLVPTGSTFKTVDQDFLISDSPDFHPTHIVEDADGSLIVADTGGWYKLCCPTSQLYKPDVLGALYRIRKADAKQVGDPRGLALNWNNTTPDELSSRLKDTRPQVRKRAIGQLAHVGAKAVASLKSLLHDETDASARIAAVWALTRIDDADARIAVVDALGDSDETVRQAAIHSASLWRSKQATPKLIGLLGAAVPKNRRAAAEALGRIGDASAVPALLEAASQEPDRGIEHSITYALIEIGDADAVAPGLMSEHPEVRRVAMIALDQMPGNRIPASRVVPLLTSSNATLRSTAEWLVSRHDDWGGTLAGFFRSRLANPPSTDEDRRHLATMIAGFANDDAVQQVVSDGLKTENKAGREICLDAVGNTDLKSIPVSWIEPIASLLDVASGDFETKAVKAARALPIDHDRPGTLEAQLLRVARHAAMPTPVRLDALAAIPPGRLEVDDEIFGFLVAQLKPGTSVSTRTTAAGLLGTASLTEEQLLRLIPLLPDAGPMELNSLLGAFDGETDGGVGVALMESLASIPPGAGLRRETIEPHLTSFPDPVKEQAGKLYAELEIGNESRRTRIDGLLESMGEGDVRRGQALFNSPQLACSSCHAIGYLGGTLGPDLTTIGTIRTKRDLLEAVLFPSAGFVRSYEPVSVTMTDGSTYSGIMKEDEKDGLVLAVGPDAAIRVARSDVVTMSPGRFSVMPEGLTAALSPAELADLIAFLKATKWR